MAGRQEFVWSNEVDDLGLREDRLELSIVASPDDDDLPRGV